MQITACVCDVTSRLRIHVSVCRATNESIIASLIGQDGATFCGDAVCRIVNPLEGIRPRHTNTDRHNRYVWVLLFVSSTATERGDDRTGYDPCKGENILETRTSICD